MCLYDSFHFTDGVMQFFLEQLKINVGIQAASSLPKLLNLKVHDPYPKRTKLRGLYIVPTSSGA